MAIDPIEKLLSIDNYQEFLLTLKSYSVNEEEMKLKWRERRNSKPKAVEPRVVNRSMASTVSTKKVVTETTVTEEPVLKTSRSTLIED